MKTVLGIDLGTQSLKILFYDYEAREVVTSAAAPLEVSRRDDGTAEQEAHWWVDALRASLDQVPRVIRSSVRAVAVSGQQHGFVPVDEDGEVLAPVKLWCDTSTQVEADEIMEACGGRDACIRLTGNPVLVGYTAPKIRWLARHRPEAYRQLATVLLPHDYLNSVLTGSATMEYGDASGTGLLDVRSRQWSDEMLRAVAPDRQLSDCLPPLLEAGEVAGTITGRAAADFGLPIGIPVATGGGDNMMAAIGTGNVTPGRLTMSLGTSGTLFAFSNRPVIDEAGNIAAFCSSTGGWLPLLCTMNCTLATELIKQAVGIGSDQFEAAVNAVAAGSDDVIVLPYFSGERTPDLPRARATILGLTTRTCTPEHLLRATLEGATYALRFGLDEMLRLGIEATEIVLTGGGARSATWCQVVADVCRLPVTRFSQDEGASFGAALQALWTLRKQQGDSVAIGDIVAEHLTVRPDLGKQPIPENTAVYRRGYAAYRRSLEQVTPLFDDSHGENT